MLILVCLCPDSRPRDPITTRVRLGATRAVGQPLDNGDRGQQPTGEARLTDHHQLHAVFLVPYSGVSSLVPGTVPCVVQVEFSLVMFLLDPLQYHHITSWIDRMKPIVYANVCRPISQNQVYAYHRSARAHVYSHVMQKGKWVYWFPDILPPPAVQASPLQQNLRHRCRGRVVGSAALFSFDFVWFNLNDYLGCNTGRARAGAAI